MEKHKGGIGEQMGTLGELWRNLGDIEELSFCYGFDM
jgi:hypothetical protein